ncbi:FAD-dependent oxidoreductase [Pseudaestuariivita atlantica]|uniref:D-amino-acid oxidase n=1 Tax=Pseudaestuariivita atlantica TaxID=1317121 RepID=A0A0L1JPY0_9RHOB|nr:FAD-dependent oxidoreductase [Pseudaestuariivita atlantica]KNG93433.1 thiamine biosynthesis protein thio [Pseudaestuariivita atlantica]
MSAQVTIVGAGVAGLCAARALAWRGAEVVVWDREAAPGPHHCSWWAGGMLAPYCEAESAEPEVVAWGQSAADWWERAGAEVTRNGSLVVSLTRDRADLARFAKRTEGYRTVGAAGIAELEPDLEGRVSQGLFFEAEAHLTPRAAMAGLRAALQADGVRFRVGEVEPASLPGTVVDTRGFSARDVLDDLRGVKGEMLVLSCPEVSLSRPVRLLHPRMPFYIVPRGGGIFMLGATQIEAVGDRITARSMMELLNAAYALNPAFGEAEVVEIGVDSRPAFPDNLPRVVRDGAVIRANGLFRHGFLLGPWLGERVADMVMEARDARRA